jgi:hypothetical protein
VSNDVPSSEVPRRIVESQAGLWILGATLLGAGALVIVVGLKQRAGTLRRNWLAGLRTWETMRSDAAWHAAHAATAGSVTAAGVVLALAGAGLVVLRPTQEAAVAAIVLGGAAVTVGLVLSAAFRGHRIAKRVNREGAEDRARDPGDR